MKVVGNVFHDFYRQLVQALYDVGASPYVFCVNVDAVIAALLLALLWKDYKSGALAGIPSPEAVLDVIDDVAPHDAIYVNEWTSGIGP